MQSQLLRRARQTIAVFVPVNAVSDVSLESCINLSLAILESKFARNLSMFIFGRQTHVDDVTSIVDGNVGYHLHYWACVLEELNPCPPFSVTCS